MGLNVIKFRSKESKTFEDYLKNFKIIIHSPGSQQQHSRIFWKLAWLETKIKISENPLVFKFITFHKNLRKPGTRACLLENSVK